jgi:hypothetical protein
MRGRCAAVVAMVVAGAAVTAGQTTKPTGPTPVLYTITVKADDVYTGTIELATEKGTVSGNMQITSPTPITGKVAGTSKAGVITLDYPYVMTARNCEGRVMMTIKMPPKPGPAAGTMEALSCGDPSRKLTGTVELVPANPKSQPR